MSVELNNRVEESFEISAVSRLTGISTHTLRIWERRYGLVSPDRSDSKRRRYTREDIRRLTLVKTLIDDGDSVGTIAELSTSQLEERIRKNLSQSGPAVELGPVGHDENANVCRVAVIGVSMATVIQQLESLSPEMKIMATVESPDELEELLKPGSIDILLIEQVTLFEEDISKLQELVERLRARRGLVVYHYTQGKTLEKLEGDVKRLTAIKAPVDGKELRLACLADLMMIRQSGVRRVTPARIKEFEKSLEKKEGEAPQRMFTDEQLEQISQISSVVQCECPQHLATILKSLNGFEQYSLECENRNEDDAVLHAHLYRTSAEARNLMERALADVIKAEGIELD